MHSAVPCTGPGKLLSVSLGGWWAIALEISNTRRMPPYEAVAHNKVAFIKMSSNQAIRLFSCSLAQGSK